MPLARPLVDPATLDDAPPTNSPLYPASVRLTDEDKADLAREANTVRCQTANCATVLATRESREALVIRRRTLVRPVLGGLTLECPQCGRVREWLKDSRPKK